MFVGVLYVYINTSQPLPSGPAGNYVFLYKQNEYDNSGEKQKLVEKVQMVQRTIMMT